MKSITCLSQSCLDTISAMQWKSQTSKNKAIQFVDHLIDKTAMEKSGNQFIQLSSKYFQITLGSHYSKVIKPLINHGVLETDESYVPSRIAKNGKGESKGYRLNPDFLKGRPIIFECGKKKKKRAKTKVISQTKKSLSELRVPPYIFEVITTFTTSDIEKGIKFNEEIEDDFIYARYEEGKRGSNEYPYNTSELLSQLEEGQLLYQYKDKYFITKSTKQEVLKTKLFIIKRHWMKSMYRIKKRDVYADRNKTNQRLDSNITSMKTALLMDLVWDNEYLKNLDLKNSQFRIFVWALEYLEKEYLRSAKDIDFSFSSNLLKMKSPIATVLVKASSKHLISTSSSLSSSSNTLPYFVDNSSHNTPINRLSYTSNLTLENIDLNLIDVNCIDNSCNCSCNGSCNGSCSGSCSGCGGMLNGKVNTLSILLRTFKETFIEKEGSTISLSDSYMRFKELVKSGKLYNEMAIEMGLSLERKYTRDEAKATMFMIAFAKPGYRPKEKMVFRELFPCIVEFIDHFKKICKKEYLDQGLDKHTANEKGNSAFAITLQKIESQIFIDIILSSLYKKGYKVLSKHDSILCKESDVEEVKIEMKVILDDFFGVDSYELKEE